MVEIKVKKQKRESVVYLAKCPYCGIEFEQEYEKQLKHNVQVHILNCEENLENK
jgi:hypothetical protein